MSGPDFTQPPDTYKGEVVQMLIKMLASSIPIIGPMGAEVIGLLIQPQVTKRRDEWLQYLGTSVAYLMQQRGGPTPEELLNNEAFTTAFLHASQIAIRTHQKEKLKALRNAVLNVAAGTAPDDDRQLLFLDAIDSLTPSHLRLLAYFSEMHKTQPSDIGCSVQDMFERAVPQLKGKREFYNVLYENLVARGFLMNALALFESQITPETVAINRTSTPLGDQLLSFIKAPIDGLDDRADGVADRAG